MAGAVGYVVGGRYRLLELIGQGGMGRVWRAADGQLGREVAVKEIALPAGLPEDERVHYVTRMEKEARSTARLSHPNVITVHDVVHEGGVPWIVMEFVAGESLAALLKRNGPLPWPQAVLIGAQVAQALAHAHDRQIVHRDLKPDNVLLAGQRVVLTDFGIARVLDETMRQTSIGAVIGTPHYMSPEQIEGRALGPATDLWSLGVLLYGAVEGTLPYSSPTIAALFAAILTQPVPTPRQAGPLTPVVVRLLTKDALQRPRAAETADFLARLGPGHNGPPPQWPTGPTAVPGQRQPQFGSHNPYNSHNPQHNPPHPSGVAPGPPQQPGASQHPYATPLRPGWQTPYAPPGGPGLPAHGQHQPQPYSGASRQPYGGVPGAGLALGSGNLASWGQRVGATILDSLCLFPAYIAYGIFYATVARPTTDAATGVTTTGGNTAVSGIALLIALAYGIGFELWQLYRQGTTGQTLGKRALSIRVVRERDGRYTGFGGAFVRSLAHYIDALACYVGFLAPLWDVKHQTFADKICHTVVVQG